MLERMRVDEFLTALLSIVQPLAPIDLPLLDAHGATLAEDIFAGERLVLKAGSPIRSTTIGMAASIGRGQLPTRPQPRVVVISAGPDLVEPGNLISGTQEFETNSWQLTTIVREIGGVGFRVHSIPDDEEELKDIVEDQLVRADLIVISGEQHDESFDLITSVLQELGEITIVEPALDESGRHNFGTIGPDKTPVVTLPGDPIAAYLSSELFIRPMIRTMFGSSVIHRHIVKAQLTENVESPIGKTSLIRANLGNSSPLTVTPLAEQEHFATLADAHALIAISADSPGAIKGESVDVMILERIS